jgi:hypothetical protein
MAPRWWSSSNSCNTTRPYPRSTTLFAFLRPAAIARRRPGLGDDGPWCRAGRPRGRGGSGWCHRASRGPARSARRAPSSTRSSVRTRSAFVNRTHTHAPPHTHTHTQRQRRRTLMADTSRVGPFQSPRRRTAAASLPPRLPATNTSGGSAGGGGGGGGPPAFIKSNKLLNSLANDRNKRI